MAITYVAAGVFQGGQAALTVPLPAGTATNDLLIIAVESANEAVTTPTEWTLLTTAVGTGTAGAAGAVRLTVFYKFHDGSEASVTIADSGNHQTAQMFALRGVNKAAANFVIGSGTLAAGTALTIPAVTTTAADSLVFWMIATDRDLASTTNFSAFTNANLTSITEVADEGISTQQGGGLAAWTSFKATAATTGDSTVTQAASVVTAYTTLALTPQESHALAASVTNVVAVANADLTVPVLAWAAEARCVVTAGHSIGPNFTLRETFSGLNYADYSTTGTPTGAPHPIAIIPWGGGGAGTYRWSNDLGSTWVSRTYSAAGSGWNLYAFGAGLFVCVNDGTSSQNHAVHTSPDGITWTSAYLPPLTTAGIMLDVGYGNGKFVILTQTGTNRWVSADGLSWTLYEDAGGPAAAITSRTRVTCLPGGTWVLHAEDSDYATSSDGVTWTSRTLPGGLSGNGRRALLGSTWYLTQASASFIWKTTNGVDWSSITNPFGVTTSIFGNGLALYADPSVAGNLSRSTNGTDWTTITTMGAGDWQIVAEAVGQIEILAIWRNSFTERFQTETTGVPLYLTTRLEQGAIFGSAACQTSAGLQVSTNFVRRTDLEKDTSDVYGSSSQWPYALVLKDRCIYGPVQISGDTFSRRYLASEDDGASWYLAPNQIPDIGSGQSYSAATNGTKVIRVRHTFATTANLASTTDGLVWTTTSPSYGGGSYTPKRIYYYNGEWIILLPAGIFTSPDGDTWTLTTGLFASLSNLTAHMLYDPTVGIYVVTGVSTAVYYTSPDLTVWTERALPNVIGGTYEGAVTNGVYMLSMAAGSTNLLRSTDGTSWTQISKPSNSNDVLAAVGTEFHFAKSGGQSQNIYRSVTGESWINMIGAGRDSSDVPQTVPFALTANNFAYVGARSTSVRWWGSDVGSRKGRARVKGVDTPPAGDINKTTLSVTVIGTATLTEASSGTDVAASSSNVSSVTGALTTGISMNASVVVQSSVINANFTVPINFVASIESLSTALSASLTTALRLNAVVSAQTTITGAALATEIRAQTSIAALSTVTGAISTSVRLNSSAAVVSSLTGDLTTAVRLVGSISALSTSTSALTAQIQLASTVAAISTVTSDLTVGGAAAVLEAAVASAADVTGAITTAIRTAASVSAVSTATADLTTYQAYASLVENFSGTLDPGIWDNFGDFGGAGSDAIVGGKLRLSTTAVDDYAAMYTVTNRVIAGSSVYAWIGLSNPATNSVEFSISANLGTGVGVEITDGVLSFWTTGIGFGSSTTTYDPAVHAWFRFREASGTIYIDTAPATATNPPSSGDWVERRASAYTAPATGHELFLYGYNLAGGAWHVEFDGINTGATLPAQLATSAAVLSTVTGALTTAIQPAASVAALSTITGALTTAIQPAANIEALSTVTGALTTDIRLAASVEALSTATADLTAGTGIPLDAAVTDVVSTTGALTTDIALVASLTAQTNNVLASLNTGIPLVGVLAAALSTTTAALTTDIRLAASIAAVTENSGALTTEISLTSSVAALSTVAGALTTQIALASDIAAVSTATATMFSAGTPTLSNPTVINKTTTTVTPRVTYSF